MRKRGYTLIELLVSVAIFVGLLVIAIATFARSTAAINSTADLREKSQALRRVVDGISNDWRYLYLKNTNSRPDSFRLSGEADDFYGFALPATSNDLYLVLRYPNESKLVVKHYQIAQVAGRSSITLDEARGCVIDPSTRLLTDGRGNACVGSGAQDLLPSRWALDSTGLLNQPFTGQKAAPNKVGYLKLNLTLKASELGTTSCTTLAAGTCYGVVTSFTQGLE